MDDFDRIKAALDAYIEAALPRLKFAGFFEYQVIAQSGQQVDVSPVDSTLGMPTIPGLTLTPSIIGGAATLHVGDVVIVGFRDMSPAKPFIAFGDPNSVPSAIDLAGAGSPSARSGDSVRAGFLFFTVAGSFSAYFPGTAAGETAAVAWAFAHPTDVLAGGAPDGFTGEITSGSSILTVGP